MTTPTRTNPVFALFVDRPVLTLMTTLAILMVGVVSLIRVPLRLAPEGLTTSEINIYVPVPQDRSPSEVEDRVAKPLEELLRTIPGIAEVESESDSDSARFWVKLDEGLDPILANAEVRDRLQRARLEWPPEVERYFTWREDPSSAPLAFFQMLTPERSPDWDFLLDKVVLPRLEAVEGVGRVDIYGLLDESIRIWFDRDKLMAHRVDFYRLMQRLGADNFAEPVGEVDDGEHRFLARIDAKFRTLDDIRSYPVTTGLVVGDIARVERVPSIRNQLSRYNQKYTYSGMLRAASGTNPVDASANLHAALANMQEDPRLAGLEFRFLFDQGEMITESLDTLLFTSLQGGALALVALLLFLRNLRFTLAIALAIPMALMMVGGWLFFSGGSLNILTMAGMTLAVGMVVDNSVVVLENIRRLRARGLALREACVQGAGEVGLAVAMATMTTVVVILPMMFMGSGSARITLGAVGGPLSIALIGSLVVALLLMPSGLRHLGARGTDSNRAAKLAAAGAPPELSWFSPVGLLLRFNRSLLHLSLRHRVLAVVGLLLVLGTWSVPFNSLEFSLGDGGPFRRGDIAVYMDLPPGLDLEQVEREVIAYEDFVLDHKEEWRVDTVSSRFSRRGATIDIGFDSEVEMAEFSDYRSKIEALWPRRPGVVVKLSDSGGGMGGAKADDDEERGFAMRLYGRDSRTLRELAQKVTDHLASRPEIAQVEIPQIDDRKEVLVELDRDRMQELEVRPEVLQGTVSSGLQGRLLTEFEERGRETRLIAEFDSEHNPTLLDLKETQVLAGQSSFQRLANMSNISFRRSLGSIERTDGRTHVSLVGRRADGVGPLALTAVLEDVMLNYPLPRGYSWSEVSKYRDSEAQTGELGGALLLGVILVFLLMGILFESLILPLSILFTIPFALLGAYWSLYLFHGSIDIMSFVGMILLAGIIVNNGIVLLDSIARLRREGMDREQAILEGTRRRIRPIVMTAVTTVFGLLPMALFGESSGMGVSYVTLSITVAGGLTLSTVFTAFVVPLAYTFMDDLRVWLWGIWRRAVPGASGLALATEN